jgi:hypothetical protein
LSAQDHKDHHKGADAKSAPKDYSHIIPKDYPLAVCFVTDEKFGEHGEDPVVYTHKESGKPDRVFVMCCEHCVEDFKREPERQLKKYEAAVAKAKEEAAAKNSAPAAKKGAEHKH